ncbi:DUF4202 domain-containing protein [Flexithrix dorotheae]|uniref:DUF4202 domain-containing protein n=1 Tax=Flexithrix dorotheae TaxID=70993 RepID=UPI00038234B6|nr:DUF4202 domain-containing protein [Flexithrix dorotheae]
MEDIARFEKTIKLFDEANSLDPNKEVVEGTAYPKELLYAKRMTQMLLAYEKAPSEALQLAARCQHIKRWTIPRSDYPMDRKGYLKWRTTLKIFHGEEAAKIMTQTGYDEETIKKVKLLLSKNKLKTDPESKKLEDVICLVFLQYYFPDFAKKNTDEKLVEIVQKTWGKMTEKGHDLALQMEYPERELNVIKKALGI